MRAVDSDVDSDDAGQHISLQLDDDGGAIASYFDANLGNLKVAKARA